jgi:hypothetical protein
MSISQFWTGQIPSAPLPLRVYDAIGAPLNLSQYTSFSVRLLNQDNEEVDLTGSTLQSSGANTGRFVFRWPTDRSLFEEPGEYLLQLEISGPSGTKDYTTTHTIKVRRLGGVN